MERAGFDWNICIVWSWGHMNSVIIAQAIDGRMLVELVESDIVLQELGVSRFQTMKIKQRMPYPPHL